MAYRLGASEFTKQFHTQAAFASGGYCCLRHGEQKPIPHQHQQLGALGVFLFWDHLFGALGGFPGQLWQYRQVYHQHSE